MKLSQNVLKFKIILYLILFLFFIKNPIALAASQKVSSTRPFIIDTDMGVDDVIAIIYMLQQPNIVVKGITIECDGNAHCQPALANLLGLLQLLHRSDIPVALGDEKPLSENPHHYPADILQSCDTLSNASLKKPVRIFQPKKTAQQLWIDLLTHYSSMNILALGPLTTPAQVFERAPQLKKQIHRIYLMGGAVNVPGNIHLVDLANPNQVAEWNIYMDPKAAQMVFHSNVPLTLVPLDVTNQVLIDESFFHQLKMRAHTPSALFLVDLFSRNHEMLLHKDWFFWDPMAAVIAVESKKYMNEKIHVMQLSVKLYPEDQSGGVYLDLKQGGTIDVVTQINSEKFKRVLLDGVT